MTNESYVEYILSQCKHSCLSLVCSKYKTKEQLLEAVQKGYYGKRNILGDGLIVRSAIDLLNDTDFVNVKWLSSDAQKIFDRCMNRLNTFLSEWCRYNMMHYDRVFDALVELNWLLASIYYNKSKANCELVLLLDSPIRTRTWAKKALEPLLLSAEGEKSKSEKFEAAASLKYQLLPGLFADSEVQWMLQDGYTRADFVKISKEHAEKGIEFMALYYALTATAALSEEFRRTL